MNCTTVLHCIAMHCSVVSTKPQCLVPQRNQRLGRQTEAISQQCTHCTLRTTYFTLYAAHYILHTVHYTLHTSHCTLHIAYFTLHVVHWMLHTVHWTLHTTHCTFYTERYTRQLYIAQYLGLFTLACSGSPTDQGSVWSAVHCHLVTFRYLGSCGFGTKTNHLVTLRPPFERFGIHQADFLTIYLSGLVVSCPCHTRYGLLCNHHHSLL